MTENDKNNAIDVEIIGDGVNIIAKETLTPADYFNYVKSMKSIVDISDFETLRESCLSLLKKAVITGQIKMAKELTEKYEQVLKEIRAIENGYNVIIFRTDVEKYIASLENNPIRVIELSNYERDIPDDVINKIADAKEKNLFDEYYVIFTDYSLKETKKIAKQRHEKDPILFGAFKSKLGHDTPSERLFFIADWVDEKCDLTLNELVEQYKKSTGDNLAFIPNIPTSPEELKKYINSLDDKETAKEQSNGFFTELKNTVKKTVSKKKRSTRKKANDEE